MPHRREPLVALATAACVLAVLLAQQLIGGATAVIATVLYGHSLPIASTLGGPTLLYNLVFAVGLFFALWLVVPVSAEFRLTRVILRGLALSALATALLFVVTVLVATYASFIGPLGGMTGFDGRSALEGSATPSWLRETTSRRALRSSSSPSSCCGSGFAATRTRPTFDRAPPNRVLLTLGVCRAKPVQHRAPDFSRNVLRSHS